MKAISYKRPPVVEVIFGVQFDLGGGGRLKTADIGRYWALVKKEFPVVEEAVPIPSVREIFDSKESVAYELMALPPLRRTWFFDESRKNLIQIQEDRFIFNWKQEKGENDYPRYEKLIQSFNRHLEHFLGFLSSELAIQNVIMLQYELTYVNHIGNQGELSLVSQSELLIDHSRDKSKNRFLPEVDSFDWKSSYLLPDNSGRLHITALSAIDSSTGGRLVRLDMTARGFPNNTTYESRSAWFNQAREWIVRGFADSVADELQLFWGRHDD